MKGTDEEDAQPLKLKQILSMAELIFRCSKKAVLGCLKTGTQAGAKKCLRYIH